MNVLTELPTKRNSVTKVEQIQPVKIRFAKVATLATLYNVSKATIYRFLREAEQSGEWPKLFVELTSALTLVNLEEFERFLYSKHRKYL